MKTSKRFDVAIASLMKGYINGTLAKGNCAACAVGNMVAGATGRTIKTSQDFEGEVDFDFVNVIGHINNPSWQLVFATSNGDKRLRREKRQVIEMQYYKDSAQLEIDATGYSIQELADVEWAFEKATKIMFHDYHRKRDKRKIDEDQLNGLYAVVDVLCKIEGYDDTVAQETKDLFVKSESLCPLPKTIQEAL
jgi:hypothetical protein